MIESGIGYIVRTKIKDKNWYWTGAYKESKWGLTIYEAKLYKYLERAQSVIDKHIADDYAGEWDNAEIIKIKFQEVL